MKPIFLDKEPDFDEEIESILEGSGKNKSNRLVLRQLREAFTIAGEENEWLALKIWFKNFYGYQQTWLLDQSNISLSLKARQAGGSLTYAAVAVLWGILGQKTAIISIGQREANRVLKYARGHLEVLAGLGSKRALITGKNNAETVELRSNGSISSLPPSSAARGDSTNIILDEAAYYKNPPPDAVIDAAFAATTHKGLKIRILSTPNGVGNKFYLLCKDHKKLGYTLHKVTIEEAIEDGLPVSLEKCKSLCLDDPRVFAQVYGCSFLDSQLQYILTESIDACCFDELPKSEEDERYYGGLDIGRNNDLTVLLTIQRCGKVDGKQAWAVRGLEKHRRTSEEGLNRLVDDGFKKYKYKRLSLDATGIGIFPADAMVKRHGFSKVDPVMFTSVVKEELATGLKQAIVTKRLFLPKKHHLEFSDQKDVRQLLEDIAAIQRIITENGNIKYEAPHTIEGHADRAWALALSVRAGLTAPTYARLPS